MENTPVELDTLRILHVAETDYPKSVIFVTATFANKRDAFSFPFFYTMFHMGASSFAALLLPPRWPAGGAQGSCASHIH